MEERWRAEITNDPTRDFELCVELYGNEHHRATIRRLSSGALTVVWFFGAKDGVLEVPADWLRELLDRAERELPAPIVRQVMAHEEFEQQWAFVLNHPEEQVRRIAERASREPVLRRLFPYASMSNLRFSTTSTYPYSQLPYVLTAKIAGRYEARDVDNRPLAEGDLDVVIAAVVRAIQE